MATPQQSGVVGMNNMHQELGLECTHPTCEKLNSVKVDQPSGNKAGDTTTALLPLHNQHPPPQVFGWSEILPTTIAVTTLCITIYLFLLETIPTTQSHVALFIPLVMVFGHQVLSNALAICTANSRQDSPHFGCGWLAWSFYAMVTALSGSSKLVPKPEIDCKIMDLSTGKAIKNQSFLLSRIVRDLQTESISSMDGVMVRIMDLEMPTRPLTFFESMTINSISVGIMMTQLCMATYAFFKHGEVAPILLFSIAIFTMEGIARLPAWRAQKFPLRNVKNGKLSSYALMYGIRYRQIIIIRNVDNKALDIEAMANGSPVQYDYFRTWEAYIIITSFFAFLAVTVISVFVSDGSAIYLLGILYIGTVGNVNAVCSSREPWMHGIPMRLTHYILGTDGVLSKSEMLDIECKGYARKLLSELCEPEAAALNAQ